MRGQGVQPIVNSKIPYIFRFFPTHPGNLSNEPEKEGFLTKIIFNII